MPNLKKFSDYKYHTSFVAIARCGTDEAKSKLLATASIDDLKVIIPKEALTDGFEDLLPIAANACVANFGNKRGDMISTATALKIYKNFANKFINLEHDRKMIVGHLVGGGLSKFDSNYRLGTGSEPVKEESIASTNDPFNISVAGYIYAVANPEVAKRIVMANDPEDGSYLSIALSWELAFDDYKIAIGNANLGESEIIDDPKEIERLSPYLKCNKGTGIADDGRQVYRLIDDGVVPLGVALTFSPAADVTGVYTSITKNEAAANEADAENKEIDAKTKKIVSQASNADVTINIPKSMKTLKTLADLQALNDENKVEYSFANTKNIIEAEMERIAREHQTKLQAEATEKAELTKKATDALASVEELKKQVETLKTTQASQEATNRFNDRMSGLDEEYDLTDKQRKAIASQIRSLDDTAFASWKTDVFEAFAAKKNDGGNSPVKQMKTPPDTDKSKGKKANDDADDTDTKFKKSAKAAAADDDDDDEDEEDKIADADAKKKKAKKDAKASDTVIEALANAKLKSLAIANTTDAQESVMNKYRKAFSTEKDGGLEIVQTSRR